MTDYWRVDEGVISSSSFTPKCLWMVKLELYPPWGPILPPWRHLLAVWNLSPTLDCVLRDHSRLGSCRNERFHELQQHCVWLDWWWYMLYQWASRVDASQIFKPGLEKICAIWSCFTHSTFWFSCSSVQYFLTSLTVPWKKNLIYFCLPSVVWGIAYFFFVCLPVICGYSCLYM